MKICITSSGPDLDSLLDFRFGRCNYFVIIDEDRVSSATALKNDNVTTLKGAGVAVAQVMVNTDIKIVITGNVGPNAYYALDNAGIKVFLAESNISVREALRMYQAGELEKMVLPLEGAPD